MNRSFNERIDGKQLKQLEHLCSVWRASVSPLGLNGKAEVSTAYHFPETDAPIHHPFSVWFQSVLYLLISPRRDSGPVPGRNHAERLLVYLWFYQQSVSSPGNTTPHDDTAPSYEAKRNTTQNYKIKKENGQMGLPNQFWKEVILGRGIIHRCSLRRLIEVSGWSNLPGCTYSIYLLESFRTDS